MPGRRVNHGRLAAQVLQRNIPFGTLSHFFFQLERMVAPLPQEGGHRHGPVPEIGRVFHGNRAPADLRDGKDARIEHVFRMGRFRDHLVPEIALHAEQMLPGILGDPRSGVIDIDAVQGKIPAEGLRFQQRRILGLVQIAAVAGRHDGVMAFPDGLQAPFGPAPGHDRGVR